MIGQLKRFEGSANGRRAESVRITLSPRKFFALNQTAYRALGEPLAIELYFDEHDKKIGMRRCDPVKKYAFRVTKEKGKKYFVVYAGTFCTHFQISTKRTVMFDSPQLKPDFMVIVDLAKTTRVGRGSR